MKSVMVLVGVLVILFGQVKPDASDHRFKVGDPVPLYANKLGPFRNPGETYAFYDLPFCLPDNVKAKEESLGEVLNGDRLVSTAYKINFLVDKESQVLCNKRLTREDVYLFRTAISKDYYYQMYLDDLPIWSFIGKIEKEQTASPNGYKYFIFTHIHFDILYNKDRVIDTIARSSYQFLADVTVDKETDVEFRYTVEWKETNIPFEKRMEKYTMSAHLPHHLEIHWFSIMNSCVTAFVLTCCLIVFYVRVLKKDIMMYANNDGLAENQDERGWKLLHGDVFRYPRYKSLLAAALGSGSQLFTLTMLILLLGVFGVFYPYSRGYLMTAIVIIYAITSAIGGFTAVSFYCQLEGTNWVRNMLFTGCLFCGPLILVFCFVNSIAITYRATAALPFGTIGALFSIWIFLASPLLLLGGIAGKNSKSEFQAPCHTTKCPRQIPPQRWYKGTIPQMALAGILPFSVVYVEVYYTFASIWGHRIYTLYDVTFIAFILLLIITAFVTVALIYYQLAAENHEWWWRSFLYGGSIGLFIYGYCFYYYFARSDMSGLLQTSMFFGYMACICLGIFLMLGTVGFYAALLFVRYIYGSIKCE